MKDSHPITDERTLRLLLEGTVAETGVGFFRALVKNLCNALGTMAAWVTEYLPNEGKLRSYAMWINGEFIEHYEYFLNGTPCQPVIEKRRLVHIGDQVIDLFPKDSDLRNTDAVSYLGMPIQDVDGSVIGHLGLLDNKVMPRNERTLAIFEIFAARAAGEMRRLKAEAELTSREQQLAQLIDSTMDAILVLDEALVIQRVNPSAERLFGCTAEDLTGEHMTEFLVETSSNQLSTLCRRMADEPDARQQAWIPENFVVRRWDHTIFPAEVTFSRYKTRHGIFQTLIMRNSDDRLDAERQIQLLTQETEYLREIARDVAGKSGLIGSSSSMKRVFSAIQQVAVTGSTVLITGETGTGKELIARSIHQNSKRANQPLILVNCAAIPSNLIESEFFGHERGAFTGAIQRREGRFKLADGGTIFLDEVGELPLELQAKLLRVLQEGEFEPLGSSRTVKVDVRVISATNRDLKAMVEKGQFREDLFFRLNVFPLSIPPLRERGNDMDILANTFAERFSRRMGKHVQALSEEQLARLHLYQWPGNVRELQNVIERAIILTNANTVALDQAMAGIHPVVEQDSETLQSLKRILSAREMLELEKANITAALESCSWKVSGDAGAAHLLGVPPSTLTSRMKALSIQRPSN